MNRTSTIVTIAILSSILTPVVVKATGTTPAGSTPVQEAKVEMAAATPVSAAKTPACARSVKVVYAGYGEAHAAARAACMANAEIRH